jgi:D-hexose-6-phosphate mutarotase
MLRQRATPYPHWEFTHPSLGDQLRVVPERGGLVSGWRCAGREILYLDIERFSDPALSVRGGIPVLFPICGGLPADFSALPQHGFARDQVWSLAALPDGDGVLLELADSPETLRVYPHPFRLRMAVRLQASALAVEVQVENRGAAPLPFSFGLHPYFAVSALEAVEVEGLPPQVIDQTTMASAERDTLLAALPSGIDVLAEPSQSVRLRDSGRNTAIRLETTAPLDLAVLWSDPPRRMVCLEPWSGPRGALLSGDRLLEAEPGGQLNLRTRFCIEDP